MKQIILLISICLLSSFNIQAQTLTESKCGIREMTQKLIDFDPDIQVQLDNWQAAISQLENIANTGSRAFITVPVVIHVIHNGESIGSGANLSVNRILSQIDVLNEDYSRSNTNASSTPSSFLSVAGNPEISFCLATVDPFGNPSNGITREEFNVTSSDYIEDIVKPATGWPADDYLNIWVAEIPGGSVLGYSYLPFFGMVGSDIDGVVIDYRFFGRGFGSFGQGRTATHEVGHYLGLNHVWSDANGNGGCSNDDGISDTPVQLEETFGCPPFPQVSCGSNDMFMNYMDYVNDGCMNLFTQGQVNVMRAVLSGTAGSIGYASRSNLLNNAEVVCSGVELVCANLADEDLVMGFEVSEDLSGWRVENTNADLSDAGAGLQDHTWFVASDPGNGEWGPHSGSDFIVYLWNFDNSSITANDWFFTECISMQAGELYELSFWYAAGGDVDVPVYPEKLKVALATDRNSASVQDIITDLGAITNAYPVYLKKTETFYISESRDYSVGFHVYSDADKYAMQIDDINITRLSAPTAIEEPDHLEDLRIYPVPATDQVFVELPLGFIRTDMKIRVFDELGRDCSGKIKATTQNEPISISLSGLTPGVYFLKVENSEESIQGRFLHIK